MSNVTYYVAMGFERDETGELVAMDPVEAQSPTQAVSRARTLAVKKAGAIAFSRTGDPNLGEFADAVCCSARVRCRMKFRRVKRAEIKFKLWAVPRRSVLADFPASRRATERPWLAQQFGFGLPA
jgi:hypothetical protein